MLYSEIFQVTAPIHRTAVQLAGHGYVVAVPEIYHEFEAPGVVLAAPVSTARPFAPPNNCIRSSGPDPRLVTDPACSWRARCC